MSPLLTQLMQQLAFSAGRNNPDPMAFDNLLQGGDLIDEYGRPVDVGGQRMPDPRKRPPMFRVGSPPGSVAEQQGFFSVPPESIPGQGSPDTSVEDVAAIANKLRGLPTMESERIAAEARARENVLKERDRINSGLKSRNAAALAGRESPVRPQTLEQQLVAATKNVKPPSAKDRLNEILPQEPGSQVKIKGASGNGNQLVRLSDGTAMMMGPDAYREYKNALADGLDEKTAMRSVQRAASGRSAVANAGGRARELVRTQGAASLANKPELSKAITPEEVASISVDRTARLAENAAKVQQRQDRANPLLAMMRNDGTDSPIAQMFMYRQMGLSPQDAVNASIQERTLRNQMDNSKESFRLREDDINARTENTKAMKRAADLNAMLKIAEAEPDPIRRQQLMDAVRKEAGMPTVTALSDGRQMPAVNPTSPPSANANSLAASVRAGNKTPEQAMQEAEDADRSLPYDPTKPRVRIAELLKKQLDDLKKRSTPEFKEAERQSREWATQAWASGGF